MMRPTPEPPGHASRSGAIPLALERTKSAHLALLPLFSCELRRLSLHERKTRGGTPTGGAPEAIEPLDLAPPWLAGVGGVVCGAQTDHIVVLPPPAALPAPAPRNWLGATRSG